MMDAETEIRTLKEQRSKLKNRVTLAAGKIEKAIQRNKDCSDIEQLTSQLDSVYEDFSELHMTYSEKVLSEEKFGQYAKVGGLSLEDYFTEVKTVYERAEALAIERETLLNKSKADDIVISIQSGFDDCNYLSTQLDEYCSSSSSCNEAQLDVVFQEVDQAISNLTGQKQDLKCFSVKLMQEFSSIFSEVDKTIVNLKRKVLGAKQKVLAHAQHGVTSNTTAPATDQTGENNTDHVSSDHNSYLDSDAVNNPGSSNQTNSSNVRVPLMNTHTGSVTGETTADGPRQLSSPFPGNVSVSLSHTPDLSITSAYANRNTGRSNITPIPNQLQSLPANPVTQTHRSESRFKKPPAPTFDGNRRQWAEFRAIWSIYANSACTTDEDRAWALKQCLKGQALAHVAAIYVNQVNAYQRMWYRLESIYSDIGMSVQYAFEGLKRLKAVKDDDLKGFISLVNAVEQCYSQLGEVGQLSAVTMTHIDDLGELLPLSTRKEWMRRYRDLAEEEKIHPFSPFMLFLESEREITIRLSERQTGKRENYREQSHTPKRSAQTNVSATKPAGGSQCVVHNSPGTKHTTDKCRDFLAKTNSERKAALARQKACFRCFKNHMRKDCTANDPCTTCGLNNHHVLLCNQANKTKSSSTHDSSQTQTGVTVEQAEGVVCHANNTASNTVLFPIMRAKAVALNQHANLFFDSGSNTSYITHESAKRLKATKLGLVTLNITAVGKVETVYQTTQYKVRLVTDNQSIADIIAYGLPEITGPVASLDMNVVQKLFPCYPNPTELQRTVSKVDLLVGNDYYGHHPKTEIDRSGPHLSIMEGTFGRCLTGTHAQLREATTVVSNIVGCSITEKTSVEVTTNLIQTRANQVCLNKATMETLDRFVKSEELGCETTPRCGGCKCGKCPINGHTYSFKEQQELDLIRGNLSFSPDRSAWVTKYPWILHPSCLPDNYSCVLATLRNTEKTLKKGGDDWSRTYSEQIKDMVDRGVARKLTAEEIKEWQGPVFYISHLAVSNPKSNSTPVRIVFNSSQKSEGVSLNDALAKGPDCYLNNLLGILLRWREERAVLVGDIRKMFNSIYMAEEEQHCHRFLWRDLETQRTPDVYIIERVTFGDKPAPAICAEAIYKTADMCEEQFPQVATLLKTSTYVDDIVDSVKDEETAITLAKMTEEVLAKGGFKIKCWQFSGETASTSQTDNRERLKGEEDCVQVLGIKWDPVADEIMFEAALNFSPKRRGRHTEANLAAEDIPRAIPEAVTKRMVLEQVMRMYDPIGILSPFVVLAKMYLREAWEVTKEWDEPLPEVLRNKWVTYFGFMSDMADLRYDRCLTPVNAVGKPLLILLSDASDKAYGFAAYIRWKLQDGTYWCRLILAKSRIAPLRKITTPQLELNGAVLSKRGRKTIEKEMRIQFDQVYHLTDSETVLCMINKLSTRFKLYEGVRIGEIQSACDGDMSEWFWVKGTENCADWVTRGRMPNEIGPDSEWWKGPAFLYKPVEEWNIKSYSDICQKNDPKELPGEKKVSATHLTETTDNQLPKYDRFRSARKLNWTMARVFSILRNKSFKGGRTTLVSVDDHKAAERFLMTQVQLTMKEDLASRTKGRYTRLRPVQDGEGAWVIGGRMSVHNPLSGGCPDMPQKLLPTDHPYTKLLMSQAHVDSCHRGRDATLARFRHSYWTPQGSKLAKSVRDACQLCKLRDSKIIGQEMGQLPQERLQPSLPFAHVMLDLFGPYAVRGEVQKRVTGKAYGIIFTDLASRAVHIEVCYGYDTDSFLLALKRFTSIRGWPAVIFSDPGSQLTHAEKELNRMWDETDKAKLLKVSTEKKTRWVFGPGDSPWNQGAVEALVKSAKRCIKFAIGEQRLSPSEFATVCSESANILNERPLGTLPGDDATINLLTPNSLLLGRSLSGNIAGSHKGETSLKRRMDVVSTISQNFWNKWQELYAPTLVPQTKWRSKTPNLKVGDVVLVKDSNTLRSEYHLAQVRETHPDSLGVVRRVTLRYKPYRTGKKVSEYTGTSDINITRSVHKLALILPVEDQ